jgi:hypothetical protein
MRCERCDQASRVSVRRAKTAERLDELLTSMLTSDVEVATRHYDQPDDRTAA